MSKLTALHISLIGGGIAIVMSLILYFAMIKPKKEEIEASESATNAAVQAGGTEEKVKAHQKDLVKAKNDTKVITAAWAINQQRYMPKIAFSPAQKSTNLIHMYEFSGLYSDGKVYGIRDLPTVWGLKVISWYDAHSRDGVTRDFLKDDFAIESFSPDPNDISKLNSITFPQGKPWEVTVIAKSFDAAMLHLRRFNNMRGFGMPVVDNVSLEGQSPALTMTYDLALYIIPPAAPPAPDPVIGAGGGGGAPAQTGFGGPSSGGRPGGGGRTAMPGG